MFDAQRLLDQFLGAGSAGSFGPGGGSSGRSSASGFGQGAGDFLGDLQRQAAANPLASGALAGGLASILLSSRGGRKLSGSAVKMGGMALVAGLAYKAYQDWQAKQAGQTVPQNRAPEISPPPKGTPFLPSGREANDRAQLILAAMIAAAKADGHIDQEEQNRIFERLGTVSLDAEAKAYVMDQLRAPLDLDGIVRQAQSPEVAMEVYAASLLAIDPDHPAEKAYLQMLAARLGLAEDLVREIHELAEASEAPA
jgi:uncharacterized membrane protein YebE (DUF533 family)